MAEPSTLYPSALDTNTSLTTVANNGANKMRYTLSALLTSGGTSASVNETIDASVPTAGYMQIENETIYYSAWSAKVFTLDTRGADGSSAAQHAQGAVVSVGLVAKHHNILRDAIIAVETALGANLSNISVNNILIGGGFDFFQRSSPTTATSFANNSYWTDRFYTQHNGASSVQFRRWRTDDAAPPVAQPNCDSYAEIKNNSGSTLGISLSQPIESTNSIPLRLLGLVQQISARVSSGSIALKYRLYEWDGARDSASAKNLIASWSASSIPTFNSASLVNLGSGSNAVNATNWTNIALTSASAPSASANNLICVWWIEGLSASTSLYVAKAGLYAATAISPWLPRGIQQELALCQRYYETVNSRSALYAVASQFGNTKTTSRLDSLIQFLVAKRVVPAVTLTAASTFAFDSGGVSVSCDSIVTNSITAINFSISATHTAAGLTIGQSGYIYANNTNAMNIDIDAEL